MATINKIFCATGKDGTTNGFIDTISYSYLNTNDMCMVIDAAINTTLFYRYDTSNSDAESVPDIIIPNDNGTGSGAWILQKMQVDDITIQDDIISVADDINISGIMSCNTLAGLTDANTTITAYAGKAVSIEGITFDGSAMTAGGTVITDGDIADDGTLDFSVTTGVRVQGGGLLEVRGTNAQVGIGQLAAGTHGTLYLYGGTGDTTGGVIRQYIDDGSDGNGSDYFQHLILDDDFYMGFDNDTDMLKFVGGGSPALIASVGFTGTTIDADTDFTVGGTVITDNTITDDGILLLVPTTAVQVTGACLFQVGENGTTAGEVVAFGGSAAEQGGTVRVYVEAGQDDAINYYEITNPADTPDLYIGTDDNSDIIKLNETNVIFTLPVDVNAALTATTVDADTDFTVGGTVITDNTITDDGEFLITSPSGVRITDTVGADDAQLLVGTDKAQRGNVLVYGDVTAVNEGGTIRLFTALDYEGTVDNYIIYTYQGNLRIGPNDQLDALSYVGATDTWTFGKSVDFNTQAMTNVDINSGSIDGATIGAASACTFTSLTGADIAKIEWDPSPASDATMSGDIISQTVDANASGIGALMYKAADGNWEEADASASSTVGMLGIAVESSTGTKDIMLRGFVKDTAWSWTPGAQLFVSETTGAITATAPSTSTSIVQVVGHASEATVVYFNPSADFIEVA